MKFIKLFGFVIGVHALVFTVLLVQPGCQATRRERPDAPAQTGPEGSSSSQSGFDVSEVPVPPSRRQAPTRPPEGSGTTSDRAFNDSFNAGILAPVEDDTPTQVDLYEPEEITTYTVQKGDSLSSIARRNSVSLKDLLTANDLTKNSTIFPGQTLVIPEGGGEPMESPDLAEVNAPRYKVEPGDSLWTIAREHGVSVADLKSANNMSGDTIRVGQELVIPDGASRAPAQSSNSGSRSSSSASSASSSSSAGDSYTVQRGDTMSGIAKRFGVSLSRLMDVNGISDPRKLRSGQTLTIPGGTGSSPSSSRSQSSSMPRSTASTSSSSSGSSGQSSSSAVIIRPADPVNESSSQSEDDVDISELEALDIDSAEDAPIIEVEE